MSEDAVRAREDVVRSAMTLDDQLDDIKRAQIWSRIEREVEAHPARRSSRSFAALGALAACAAVVALWFAVPRPDAQALVAPADATLTAQVGPHTRAELVGPARLEIVGTPGEATHVRLRTGTLVAEFAGGPGRSLHIEAPGAAIDIVGTLFAVEVTGESTCISVAHGKVAVTTSAAKLAVATGQSWCTSRAQIEELSPATRNRFDRFTAVAVASTAPTVVTNTQTAVVTSNHAAAAIVVPSAPGVVPSAPVVVPTKPAAAVIEPPTASVPVVEHAASTARVADPPPARAAVIEPKRPAVETPTVAAVDAPKPARVDAPSPGGVEAPKAARTEAPTVAAVEAPKPAHVEAATSAAIEAPNRVIDPPKPAPVRPPAAPPTAESLYQAAEAALGKHDLAGADRALAALVTGFADSPLVDQAIYERARIAYERHAWSDARRQLEQLADRTSSPLAEPGAYLACRIDVETHDDGAVACLAAYRRAYPSSPHGLDVLGLLVDIAYRDGGCAHAAGAIAELTRRYPRAKLTLAWQARCEAHP